MTDAAINGSGVEQVEVLAMHNVLGLRVGDYAILPVDTPELTECIALGFLHVIIDGEEVIPEGAVSASGLRRCGSCGG